MLEREFNSGLLGTATPHVRFPIYRNNISQALIGALRVRFPVVEQLVGSEFFFHLASGYIDGHKPTSAVLIHYGASFADYIDRQDGATSLPYLADVAKFENAWWHAYHAFDVEPLSISTLAEWAPLQLGNLKFDFHPSFQLYKNSNGAASIWQWHQVTSNPEKLKASDLEFVTINRPHANVEIRLIAEDGFGFLRALQSGENLETAFLKTLEKFPAFDLQSNLTALFQLEFICGVLE
jgi:Putative DNA-binding domain